MTPINSTDLARFRKLVDVLEEHAKNGQISLWADMSVGGRMFVNVQLTGHVDDPEIVRRVFALPIEELLGASPRA